MAHELTLKKDGTYTMASAFSSPMSWHGLEQKIPDDSSMETWLEASGMDFRIERSKVLYESPDQAYTFPEKEVLYREDNGAPLSIVSPGYNIVQPKEVLYFFQELCEKNNLKMDTAGVIRNGVKFWALAKTGHEVCIGNNDIVKQYLLLATSCDTSMSTVAKHTSVRVVCSNTFHMAVDNSEQAIRINHSQKFVEKQVKLDLDVLANEFESFGQDANWMHEDKISDKVAMDWYIELITDNYDNTAEQKDSIKQGRLFKNLWSAYKQGMGAENTMWGWFNGVTYAVDHLRSRNVGTGLNSSMFGNGALLKKKAWGMMTQ